MQRSSLGLFVLLTALVACVDRAFGPGSQDPVSLSVNVTLPAATPAAWAPVGETLHIAVRRAGRIEPVVDTTVVITANAAVSFDVPLNQAVERFVATADIRYGGSLLFLAFDVVQLRAGTDTAVTLTAQYVGPGASAAAYTLAAGDSTLRQGDTTSLVPRVLDSLGRLIPNVPVRYVANRPTLVAVDASGLLSARIGLLDTARVTGFLPMGLSSGLVVEVISDAVSPPRTRRWVGGTAGAASDWFRPGNWSPAGDPGTGDTIVIESTGNDPVLAGKDTIAAMRISGGVLSIGRGTLVVTGDFATEGAATGGALSMLYAEDTVRVQGNALFEGRLGDGMTDGVLLVAGDLNIPEGFDHFAASGNHRSVLDGARPQRLLVGGGTSGAAFRHLEIANSAGRILIGLEHQINVTGIMRVSSPVTIDDGSGGNGDVRLEVGDSLLMVAGSRLTVVELTLGGGMAVAGAFVPQPSAQFRVRFQGTGQAIQSGLDYRDVEISGDARLTGPTTFTGDLNVFGSLDLRGQALVVTGNLHTENGNGRVLMQRAADRLEVRGNATFEGDSLPGDLTDGILRIAGTFRQLRYSNKRRLFRASGNHRTVLDGAAPQNVMLMDPTPFGHLEFANTGGLVTILGDQVVVSRTFRISTAVQVRSTGAEGPTLELDVGDSLATATGSTLVTAGLVARGPLAVDGALEANRVEFAGTNQVIPSQPAYRDVQVTGSARLAGRTTVSQDLWVHGSQAALTLAGHTLLGSSISTGDRFGGPPDSSMLVMQHPDDSLIVDGSVYFGSVATPGSLSAGVLIIRSDIGGGLFQTATPEAFQPTGSHRTVLAGSAVQVNFEHKGSGAGAAHLRHLTLADSAVVFLTGIVSVTGTLSGGSALAPPRVRRNNAMPTAVLAGGADVAGMIFETVHLAVGDNLVRLDSVTFDQQDPTVAQLSIVHPGRAGPFTLKGLRFLTTPSSGAYVSATDAAPIDGQVFTMDLVGSEPADGSSRTLTASGAVVNWIVPPAPLNFVQVSAGYGHTCGLVPGGAAYCWGTGSSLLNAFGDGTSSGRITPGPVSGGLTFSTISAGDSHSCGLTPAGAVYCWGLNIRGSLGDGTLTNRPTPVAVAGGLQFVALEAGGHTTCALTAAGAAYCWGRNNHGEIGDGTLNDRTSPNPVSGGLTFTAISVSVDSRVCAITPAGAAYCWGHNSNGEIGDGSTTDRRSPVLVAGGLTFALINTRSFDHTCAMTTGSQAYCWGRNVNGELGDGTTTPRATPTAVVGGPSFTALETGTNFTCGLTSTGAAYCWGGNGGGQLGDGTTTGRVVPTAVVGGLTFTALRAGVGFVTAIASGGAAYGWGYGFRIGSETPSAVPLPLGPPIPPP